MFITAVYVHPRTNSKVAVSKLHDAICKQLNRLPESVFIVAGDFNHSNLRLGLLVLFVNG